MTSVHLPITKLASEGYFANQEVRRQINNAWAEVVMALPFGASSYSVAIITSCTASTFTPTPADVERANELRDLFMNYYRQNQDMEREIKHMVIESHSEVNVQLADLDDYINKIDRRLDGLKSRMDRLNQKSITFNSKIETLKDKMRKYGF